MIGIMIGMKSNKNGCKCKREYLNVWTKGTNDFQSFTIDQGTWVIKSPTTFGRKNHKDKGYMS